MLILQRKPGESLSIGDDIHVSIVSVDSGGRVRLAIDAPKSFTILRSELRGAMHANIESAEEENTPLALLDFLGQVRPPEDF